MKFSEKWLRQWVNPKVASQKLTEQLSMAGVEVNSITPVAPFFSKVVIGQILKVSNHPNADKLRVCLVEIGEEEPLSIVCGASNVREGLKVAVALEGARLPQGIKIRKTKLRGVASCGMICSASELGLEQTSAGIMELPEDAPLATDLYSYYELDDNSIEVELTPNRGDCLSVAGIAREVATLNRSPIQEPEEVKILPMIEERVEVELLAPEECPRYQCRVIREIDFTATTPLWIQERLQRSGVNCISPVVDVTNYVMLELGQPLHAFDLDKISGGIKVRNAIAGERITLLNEQEIELTANSLLIADHKLPLALAGIMGGKESAVTDHTNNLLLESAFFTPEKLLGRARSYGLHTDSSHRFERGVNPYLQRKAIERATALLLDIVGGKAGPISEKIEGEKLPQKRVIILRSKRVATILGITIPDAEIVDILQRLGMVVEEVANGWRVTVPSYRFDIKLEIDLIEEIARIYGYNNIPEQVATTEMLPSRDFEKQNQLAKLRGFLVDHGYHEVVTYSFVDPVLQKLLDPESEPLALLNPITTDLSVMRTNMWPGLIKSMLYNQSRQQDRMRLFEIGLCFNNNHNEVAQIPHIAGLLSGDYYPEQWGTKKRDVDLFDLKGDLELLFARTTNFTTIGYKAAEHPALHPGQCAEVFQGSELLGLFGALHPRIKQKLEIKRDLFLFDLDLRFIYNNIVTVFNTVSKFPQARRDLAIIVDKETSARKLQQEVVEIGNKWLRNVEIFDIYHGGTVAEEKKSVALRLVFQNSQRTLQDDEVDNMVEKIAMGLKQKFNAVLRG